MYSISEPRSFFSLVLPQHVIVPVGNMRLISHFPCNCSGLHPLYMRKSHTRTVKSLGPGSAAAAPHLRRKGQTHRPAQISLGWVRRVRDG